MPPTIHAERVHLEVRVRGTKVPFVREAECRFGIQNVVAGGSFVVPNDDRCLFGRTDDEVEIRMGTTPGTGNGNNAVRLVGYLRTPSYTLDGHVQYEVAGRLFRAAQYTNQEDPDFSGGLTIANLTGSATATFKQIAQAALSRAGVPYNAAHIGCTGRLYDSDWHQEQFLWGAGTDPDPRNLSELQEAGESCLAYLLRYCAIEAVFDDSDPLNVVGGFYQLVENLRGQPHIVLMGGRPRGTPDHVFTEGVEIIDGRIDRVPPIANMVLVKGIDEGDAFGPVFWREPCPNDILPSSRDVYDLDAPSSPMIEWESIADAVSAGTGMDCETVAKARTLSVNRITPQGFITICTDRRVGPGDTALIRGFSDGRPGRLGTGEPMWVTDVVMRVGRGGEGAPALTQTLSVIGGGLPDNMFPPGVHA